MNYDVNYLEVNSALWNERVAHHVQSGFYDLEGFKQGKTSLKEIELDLLGDIRGKKLLHLQCHFGQDTLSLARMGAQVTGLDFSEKAIEQARALAKELNIPATFHPMIWMYDPEFTKITYSYFNKETIFEEEQGTYADKNADISLKSVSWNHPLADVMNGLLKAGMEITAFREYDYSPYSIFPNCKEAGAGRFWIEGLEGRLPMVYAIKAVKK